MSDTDLFYLKTESAGWEKVTQGEFVKAERAAGLYNTMGRPNEPATRGFSGVGVRGRTIDMRYARREQFDWDIEFRNAVWPGTW